MQVTGTREAFIVMLQERGVYKRLGVDRSTVANWKKYLQEGKSISLDKMEEMLIKGSATVVEEKVWDVKNLPEKYASITKIPAITIPVESIRYIKPKGKTIIVRK